MSSQEKDRLERELSHAEKRLAEAIDEEFSAHLVVEGWIKERKNILQQIGDLE
jgi:hypothetical protein